jgi:hypothetical protein
VVDLKLIVSVKYLPEPIELIASVQFKIQSPAAPEHLSNPSEALVRSRAGDELNKTVVATILPPPDWPRGASFRYKVEWLLDEASLPDGFGLVTSPIGSNHGEDLLVRSMGNKVGEYIVEVPIRVTLLGIDKTYDLVQKIKIVIS